MKSMMNGKGSSVFNKIRTTANVSFTLVAQYVEVTFQLFSFFPKIVC